jgi:hypothetical protein
LEDSNRAKWLCAEIVQFDVANGCYSAIAWQIVRVASVQMNGIVQDTTECWSCQMCEGIKWVCIKASSGR